VSIGLSF